MMAKDCEIKSINMMIEVADATMEKLKEFQESIQPQKHKKDNEPNSK